MKKLFNLSSQQKNVWNSEMFYSGTNINSIGGYILINEKVDTKLLEKAANIYIEKNEVTHYHFDLKDGNPFQALQDYTYFKLESVSLDSVKSLDNLTTKIVGKPFTLINSDLYKFKLFTLPDGTGGIIAVFHHLIADAWSLSLFISEFIDIYSNLSKGNVEFNSYPAYSEYLSSYEEYLNSSKFTKDKDYWDSVFDSNPTLTYISNKRGITNSSSSRTICSFENSFYTKILEYCKDHKCSVYTFFMAIFCIYLAKINSTSSAILGTPVLNRSNFKEKNTCGMFVTPVPFKIDIDSNITFDKFLNKVSLNQSSIFRHQKYPYSDLLNDVKSKYDITGNLYDFVLSYQNARNNKDSADIDYISTWEPVSNIGESIEAHFYDMDGTGRANIYYYHQNEKFSSKDIHLLHSRITNIAKQVLINPCLKDISIVTKEDLDIINRFNNTDFISTKNETLISMFEKHVTNSPDKKAVIFKDTYITYKDLDEKSNKLANYLLDKGIKNDDVIGIMFNRSLDLHISIWGVLKAGATYMLIDPSLPEDRVSYMLSISNTKFVITNLYINYETVSLDSSNEYCTDLPKVQVSNDDRFCIIFTSGSTGTPKGVQLKRSGIINMVNSYIELLHISNFNNFLSTSTVAFDMFMAENFIPILSGKTVILADEDEQKIPAFTSKLIKEHNVDFILSTPSKISLLLEEPDCLRNVKLIQLGGEVFKYALYKKLRGCTKADIINSYGPSECTACTTNKFIVNENMSTGIPILNTKVYIMNNDGNILPSGFKGEIVITGTSVGKGYLGKPDFNGVYHTGDIGMLSDNGELVYIGRSDNQIKLHGLRIELDEITARIMQIADIHNAVSVIKKVNNLDCICTYIKSDSNLNENDLKSELSKTLPNYMIPSHIVNLDKFPITLNGKIDTKNLPEIEIKESEFVACETNLEKKLEKIWKNIFGINKISANSSFFDLGADSLASIRLVSEIYSSLNFKIDIKDIYTYPTIKELSSFLDTLDQHKNIKIKKHKVQDYYPVSSAQRRIYYTVNMEKDNLAYNTPFGILFKTKPNIKKLENCISKVLNMHDAFKTYFSLENGDVVQKLVDSIDFKLPVYEYKNEDFIKPFDLSKAPLVHIELDHYDNKYLLQLDIHHIICDGASINIFIKEICDLYNDIEIKASSIDYIDYAVCEKIDEDDKKYWISQFNSGVPLLNMPTEFERMSIKSYDGNNIYGNIESQKILDICKKLNITPYMFLLACFYVLLYKYTMQNDIVVGSPVASRSNPQLSNIIGMFVNTIAIKQNIQPTSNFSDFLTLVKNNCLNAYNHQSYPFDELVKELDVSRDSSRSPIFDVLFTYESGGRPAFNLGDEIVEYVIPKNNTSKFDFSLEITPEADNFELRLEYCTKLYGKAFMQTLLDSYTNIIKLVLNNLDVQISKINMLSEEPYIYPKLDYPKDSRIIDLFEKQVELTPNKEALVFGNEKYTYKELEIKVNKLANHLVKYGENKVIGIMMNRRAELVISMLAILKSGAGYLPIDPTYPEDRINYIIEDSHVQLILTESKYKDIIPVKSILVDNKDCYESYKQFNTNQSIDDVSYMIYTSGSTGKPKGVVLKQSSVVNFIYGMCDRMPLKDKTIVSITTMCFDIFVFESLLPLCTGMKVIMASDEEQNNPILLNELCLKNNVQVIQTTPSKFKLLMTDNLKYLKNLDVISLAGEPFPLDLLKSIKAVTSSNVFNMYGPTETTVGSTLKDLTNTNKITIGTPLANTHALVLDNDLNPVPYNVPGMLFIGGDGVSIRIYE